MKAGKVRIRGEEVDFRPMDPRSADFWRKICTELGLPEYCPFRNCKRNRRCSTRHVMCRQVLRQEINGIVLPLLRQRIKATARPAPRARRRNPDDPTGDVPASDS